MKYYDLLYKDTPIEQTKRRYAQLNANFDFYFKGNKRFFTASGRCELLGNHTDHNNGCVLVAAITRDIIAAAKPNQSSKVRIYSDYGKIEVDINDVGLSKKQTGTSTALVKGVIRWLIDNGYKVGGIDCYTESNVPQGGGLSSSAAFEVLIATIFDQFFNNGSISATDKAKAAQYAENVYFGKPCGLLDQCGVAFGGVTFIDFKSTDKPVVISCTPDVTDKQAVLIKTEDDHSALTRYYAQIKTDMASVANMFGKKVLREVEEKDFYDYYASCQATLPLKRAYHFFEENKRVLRALEACKQGNTQEFYAMVNQSGESSRYYLQNCALPTEQSSPITEILDEVKRIDADAAVRVHGGGFRGSVLAFTSAAGKQQLIERYGDNVIPVSFRTLGATVVDVEKLFESR